jgi:hypothetical protein
MEWSAKPRWKRWCETALVGCLWFVVVSLTIWSAAALAIDLPTRALRYPFALIYLILLGIVLWKVHGSFQRMGVCLAGSLIVLVWWLSLKPSNDRQWQADVDQTPWVVIAGDQGTIHNFRDCSYRAEFDYTCDWQTKTVLLSQLRGMDIAITYWGSLHRTSHRQLSVRRWRLRRGVDRDAQGGRGRLFCDSRLLSAI